MILSLFFIMGFFNELGGFIKSPFLMLKNIFTKKNIRYSWFYCINVYKIQM